LGHALGLLLLLPTLSRFLSLHALGFINTLGLHALGLHALGLHTPGLYFCRSIWRLTLTVSAVVAVKFGLKTVHAKTEKCEGLREKVL
jgi:hypothetical protein